MSSSTITGSDYQMHFSTLYFTSSTVRTTNSYSSDSSSTSDSLSDTDSSSPSDYDDLASKTSHGISWRCGGGERVLRALSQQVRERPDWMLLEMVRKYPVLADIADRHTALRKEEVLAAAQSKAPHNGGSDGSGPSTQASGDF